MRGFMLRVNNSDYSFREGLTIKTLMEEKGYIFHRIIVKLNGKVLEEADYAGVMLNDGDNVEAIHVFAGG
jgi:thiamine biosynthesis protein ThiS